MTRRGAFLTLFAAGLALRLAWLGNWGTFDTEVQKAWSWRAATGGVASIYGPTDAELAAAGRERGMGVVEALFRLPVPPHRFEWGTATYSVDYPAGSVLGLAAAGTLYRLVDPELSNGRGFNVAINSAPLLASLAIALVLFRSAPDAALGGRRALAFWLNPAMLLAAPALGYQDPIFGALALGAVVALCEGRHGFATALVVAAGLVKPQGALLLPALAGVLLRDAGPRGLRRAAAAGLATAAVLLAPWWTRGQLWSALDGCRRPLFQTTLAPLGLNPWWIAGWLMDLTRRDEPGLPLARIVQIPEFTAWAGFDPRLPARALLLAVAVGIVLYLWTRRGQVVAIPISVALAVHSYALFGTSVHENHTLLALCVLPLTLGQWRPAPYALAASSGFAFVSLFLAAGFGRRVTRLATIAQLRGATGLDASLIVAALHVALVLGLWVCALRRDSPAAEAAA
ncbi:MAG: hypothetical protein AB7O37_17065 [Vicinamibacteria bacterium]